MPLELHVWGPSFSLPSIDPQCLAAILYLSEFSTHSTTELPWALVESSDANISPTRQLPALHDPDKGITVGGYLNIVDYLRELDPASDIDLVTTRDSEPSADLIAFSQHILTHGQSLLDLSLFVSSENYAAITRPTYSALLPWPVPFFVLPELRQAAKRRTAHLGLSSLDLDEEDDKQHDQSTKPHDITTTVSNYQREQQKSSLIPASLRTATGNTPPLTMGAILKMAHTTNHFRLEAEVDTFCEPLNELLLLSSDANSSDQNSATARLLPPLPSSSSYNKEHGSRSCSSLTCLALGYISIMLHADVPHAWLREGIRSRYVDLAAYADDHIHRIRSMAQQRQRQSPSESALRAKLSTSLRLRSRLPFPFSASLSPSSPVPSSSSSSSPLPWHSAFSTTAATITASLPLAFVTVLLSSLLYRSDTFPSLFPLGLLAKAFGTRGRGSEAGAGARTGIHVFYPHSRHSSSNVRTNPNGGGRGGGASLEDFGAAGQLIRDALIR